MGVYHKMLVMDKVEPGASDMPVITAPTEDTQVTVPVGKTGTMRVTAENADTYQWYVDRGNGWKRIEDATDPEYTTSAVAMENKGYRYYCKVSNANGSVDSPIFTLVVVEDSEIPVTGDSSMPWLWVGLAIVALAGLGWNAAQRKRRSEG